MKRKNTLFFQLEKFTLIENDKIGNKKLKELFNLLTKNQQKISFPQFKLFLQNLIDTFNFKKEIIISRYGEKALESWQEREKEINYKMVDYVEERIGKKEEVSYYEFQKGFLILLDHQNHNFKLGKKFEFRQLTLREDGLFKQNLKTKIKWNEQKSEKIEVKVSSSKNFELPNQKGLRLIIFTLTFKYLSPSETLKCGLVSKEWLSISRNDSLWKFHIKNDFFRDYKTRFAFTERSMRRKPPPRETINEKICKLLKKYKIKKDKPLFLEYWRLADQLFQVQAEHSKPQPPRKCGINVIPRNESLESSLFVEQQTQQQKQDEIEQEQEEGVGCCHDSVKQIANRLFSSKKFESLSTLKMGENEFEEWKKLICKKVSLECMDDSMEEHEIRSRLFELVSLKLFDF